MGGHACGDSRYWINRRLSIYIYIYKGLLTDWDMRRTTQWQKLHHREQWGFRQQTKGNKLQASLLLATKQQELSLETTRRAQNIKRRVMSVYTLSILNSRLNYKITESRIVDIPFIIIYSFGHCSVIIFLHCCRSQSFCHHCLFFSILQNCWRRMNQFPFGINASLCYTTWNEKCY